MTMLDYLQTTPIAFLISMTVLGLMVGSFLNVVIHRLPGMLQRDWQRQCVDLLQLARPESASADTMNLVKPGSRCPHCGHSITALENIPLVSYVALGGKCSACRKSISLRYPAIELAGGALALICAWHFGYGIQALSAALLSWSLLTLSMIDFDHQLLPDDITLPFLWLGILVNLFGTFTDLHASIMGAMAGYGTLWTVYFAFKLLTGKIGMGHGDFKLLAMLGAWLGWQMLPLIILLSSVAGAMVGVSLIVFRRHDKSKPIPFGPYLALAGWIALIWGRDITMAYIQWSSGS
jgi:leader peptidase (prepilin peptidase)/N-methyltransferase